LIAAIIDEISQELLAGWSRRYFLDLNIYKTSKYYKGNIIRPKWLEITRELL